VIRGQHLPVSFSFLQSNHRNRETKNFLDFDDISDMITLLGDLDGQVKLVSLSRKVPFVKVAPEV